MRLAQALAQQTGLAESICLILARSGVSAPEAEAYLAPTLRALMPDPSTLKDMDRATEIAADHLQRGSRVAIFADYDVDGAASAALLHDWLGRVGVQPTIYVPDRVDEGYGPNTPAMQQLAADHALILCVDCGTLSHAPIAAARAAGAEVIVLDHHLGGETLPDAGAVVNPNRQDEDGELGHLCAAGVVFMFLVSLNRARRDAGAATPDLMAMLDLVALATVADVAPLVGLNRALVRQGLAVMARRARPGLAALADTAGLSAPPAPYHLGYVLGPRINAGGRVGQADLGTRLLTETDPQRAAALAARLDAFNVERRAIEAEVQARAIAQAEARGTDAPLVWAAGEGWHPGVVGIVAARLKEAFNRPAVVIGLDRGIGKGSGRSVPGVDLGAAVAACTAEGLLMRGGGHRMAAGLTVAEAQLPEAMARLSALLARQGAGTAGPADLQIGGVLSATAASADFVELLERAGPFGAGAPQPRFALPDVRIRNARRVGETHLSLRVGDGAAQIQAMAFGAFDGPLGAALCAGDGTGWHLAGRLEIDDWGGRRKARLRLEDAAPAN
ncbi:single-stranded-DNA-specific exonuclease RecJ [Rhodobacteraceae bacterium 2CG4]|uniref:Single-stranded-DNA-specific exonuclease RecJ n=1 Tax=Halovulum marinum TaxID=2662447 RepID=A0A6L5YXF6_9RHOB|nr:single-stranded-DNA-specific exonuclease RecJ [Halovulum marinum]MSU88354.1 single-stranded-DNA-specific exonuclease RecJ [Halovulum marinum]